MAEDQDTSQTENSVSLLDSPEGQRMLLVAIADQLPQVEKLNVPLGGKMVACLLFNGAMWQNGELIETA